MWHYLFFIVSYLGVYHWELMSEYKVEAQEIICGALALLL